MPREYIGTIIKREREGQKLIRKNLCQGICSVATLYRIESGQVTPSQNVLTNLLQRLGLPDDLCRVVQSQEELEVDDQVTLVRSLSIQHFHAHPEGKPALRAEVLKAIGELEAMMDPEDNITRQFIEEERLLLGREDGTPYPPEEWRERLLDVLRITQPRFDLDKINDFCYTHEETVLVNQIAISYSEEGQRKKAIQIYQQLLRYMQTNSRKISRYIRQFTLIAANCARELNMERRYEEAVEVAQQGRRVCKQYESYHSLPMLLAILANCYAHLNNRQESTLLYWRCWHLYSEMGDESNLIHLRNDARDTLNLELP